MPTSTINPDDVVIAVDERGRPTRLGLGTDPWVLASAIVHARRGSKVYTMPRALIEPTPEEQRAAMMKNWEAMLRRDFQTEARRDLFDLASMQARYSTGLIAPQPMAYISDCGITDSDIEMAGRLDESIARSQAIDTLIAIVRVVLESVCRDVTLRRALDTLFEICIVCASAATSTLLEIGLDPKPVSVDDATEPPLPIELD